MVGNYWKWLTMTELVLKGLHIARNGFNWPKMAEQLLEMTKLLRKLLELA